MERRHSVRCDLRRTARNDPVAARIRNSLLSAYSHPAYPPPLARRRSRCRGRPCDRGSITRRRHSAGLRSLSRGQMADWCSSNPSRQWPNATSHREAAPGLGSVSAVYRNGGDELGDGLQPRIPRALLQLAQIGGLTTASRSKASGPHHSVSPAAKRRPDRKSSRCSGRQSGLAVGTTTGVSVANRLRIDRASSSRPICA